MLRQYVTRGGQKLRCGYTTGSCAAGAAGAAVQMLLTGERVATVALDTPKGVWLTLDILDAQTGEGWARCAVRKDAGDDPDVTDGMLVCATAQRAESDITVEGGEGVGRVTRPGLDQAVGAAAINSVPRQMIREQVEAACRDAGYSGGIRVVISVPGGAEIAKRTFNPRLGIEGGVSIIGTTGIVEPMSSAALVETIRLELRVLRATGSEDVLLCPGNYAETFSRETLGLSVRPVSVSNFIGEAIDAAVAQGFKRILLVGHIGKLVKLGIGMMNTHSAWGDGRMETLTACALEAGGDLPLLRRIMASATTDAALAALREAGLLEATMAALGRRVQAALERRVPEGVEIGFICYTNAPVPAVLARSSNADALAQAFRINET